MSGQPKIWCHYDRCCSFDPGSHNARFCPEHRCKRRAENARKRLTSPPPDDIEELWRLQENRKLGRLETAQSKNEWLLERSKIGFFDIESSNLDASIGVILCACIKDRGGEVHTFVAGQDEGGIISDRTVVVAIRDRLEQYDYVSTFYGTRFDIPFLNTRLLMHGERPIDRLRHIDLYFVARFKLKLHSNRLQVVAETMLGESTKTRVVGPIWVRAIAGDKAAMQYIIDHCVIDVEELENVFEKVRGFINLSAVRWRKYGGSY
jgi:uncharacterized protein YprB with RNaseH-like and TPR domain